MASMPFFERTSGLICPIRKARARPQANAPSRMMEASRGRFGNEGVRGTLGGSMTLKSTMSVLFCISPDNFADSPRDSRVS